MEKINRILADICTVREESGDYRDETGLLRCGKCGGYKERIVEVPENLRPGGKLRVKNLCPCEQEQEDRKDRERERREMGCTWQSKAGQGYIHIRESVGSGGISWRSGRLSRGVLFAGFGGDY